MNYSARISLAIATTCTTYMYSSITGDRLLGASSLLILLLALLRPNQSKLSLPAQALILVASGLIAFLTNSLLPASEGLGERPLKDGYAVVAGGGLLLASLRGHLKNPEWGLIGTLGMLLAVFLACGSVKSDPLYFICLIPSVAFGFLALRRADEGASSWRQLGWRHSIALFLLVLITAVSTSGLLVALPMLYRQSLAWVLAGIEHRAQVAFGDGPIALGSLEELLLSDRVVMRIQGPQGEGGDALRGNVYDRYIGASWIMKAPGPSAVPSMAQANLVPENQRMEIYYVAPNLDRFFLPSDTQAVLLDPKEARIDGSGIVRVDADEHPKSAVLRTGIRQRFSSLPPSSEDLQIPIALRDPLLKIAKTWTSPQMNAPEQLLAIETQLEKNYRYSLKFTRKVGASAADPVLQFLLEQPEGHCEYFASATALLARALGIPARIVTGYRVSERNPYLGFAVVRERNAHAWVEAYLEGRGWIRVDPSPIQFSEVAPPLRTVGFRAFVDAAAFLWQRDGRTISLLALLVFFIGLQIYRWRQGWSKHDNIQIGRSDPPPSLKALLHQLAKVGVERKHSETLEQIAARARETRGIERAEVLLLRFAALRYGEEGNADQLASDARNWIEASKQGPTAK